MIRVLLPIRATVPAAFLAFVGWTVSLAAAQAPTKPSLLPEVARGVSVPQNKGYHLEKLGEGPYWVTDGFYNTMFATTGTGVIVVDAPPILGEKLPEGRKPELRG